MAGHEHFTVCATLSFLAEIKILSFHRDQNHLVPSHNLLHCEIVDNIIHKQNVNLSSLTVTKIRYYPIFAMFDITQILISIRALESGIVGRPGINGAGINGLGGNFPNPNKRSLRADSRSGEESARWLNKRGAWEIRSAVR